MGAVPPDAVAPSSIESPAHTGLLFTADVVSNAGSERLPETITVQPFASVTVKEYAPADTVCDPSFIYGGVPPAAVITTAVVPPLQAIVPSVLVAESTTGSVIVTPTDALQPFASVIVYVVVPADCVKTPVPVYGSVPLTPVMVTVELPPLQAIGVCNSEAIKVVRIAAFEITDPAQV